MQSQIIAGALSILGLLGIDRTGLTGTHPQVLPTDPTAYHPRHALKNKEKMTSKYTQTSHDSRQYGPSIDSSIILIIRRPQRPQKKPLF